MNYFHGLWNLPDCVIQAGSHGQFIPARIISSGGHLLLCLPNHARFIFYSFLCYYIFNSGNDPDSAE